MAQRVTYKYYVGRKAMFDSDFKQGIYYVRDWCWGWREWCAALETRKKRSYWCSSTLSLKHISLLTPVRCHELPFCGSSYSPSWVLVFTVSCKWQRKVNGCVEGRPNIAIHYLWLGDQGSDGSHQSFHWQRKKINFANSPPPCCSWGTLSLRSTIGGEAFWVGGVSWSIHAPWMEIFPSVEIFSEIQAQERHCSSLLSCVAAISSLPLSFTANNG